MPVENFQPQNIPHSEIWPLKMAVKIPFLPEKSGFFTPKFAFADYFEPYLPSANFRADSSTFATESFEHDSQ
jgi:hypothetical protein